MNDNMAMVPMALVESMQARHERVVKRLIATIILIILSFAGIVIYTISSFELEMSDTDYVQDGQGYNVMGYGNEVRYGSEIKNN